MSNVGRVRRRVREENERRPVLKRARIDRTPTWRFFTYVAVAWIRQVYAPQHSAEWHWSRAGRNGASSVAKVCGISKEGGTEHEFDKHFDRGIDEEVWRFISVAPTRHGTRTENVARLLYEILVGMRVFETGMWVNSQCTMRHASPDGVVWSCVETKRTHGDARWGLLEIKCPFHRFYDTIPLGYAIQMQQQMWALNAEWCDFFVYFLQSGECRLTRVYRNEDWIEWIDRRARLFCSFRSGEECQIEMPSLYHEMYELVNKLDPTPSRRGEAPRPYRFDRLVAHVRRSGIQCYPGKTTRTMYTRPRYTAAQYAEMLPRSALCTVQLLDARVANLAAPRVDAPPPRSKLDPRSWRSVTLLR